MLFFILGRINADFIYRELLFLSLITFSLYLTYRILKWSKKVFKFSNSSAQYAFSGTALCAVGSAFLLRLIIALFSDFQGKDVYSMLSTGFTELLFWVSIVIATISIILVFEKASSNSLLTKMSLPEIKRKFGGLADFFLIRGIRLGFSLFEYAFDYNIKTSFLWSQAFAIWVLGCLSWIAGVPLFTQLFFLLTIIFILIGGIIFYRIRNISFNHIERTTPNKTAYAMVTFAIIVTMVLSLSSQRGLLLVLLVVYTISHFAEFSRTRRKAN